MDDPTRLLTMKEQYAVAKGIFSAKVVDAPYDRFVAACMATGRGAVIGDLSVELSALNPTEDILRFFRGHVREYKEHSPEDQSPLPPLNELVMSYSMQTTAASINNPTPNDRSPFAVKHLTVGSIEMVDGEDDISEAFEDHIPLRMALFMNWLLKTEYHHNIECVALGPVTFRMDNIDRESGVQSIFRGITNKVNDLFAFTEPALSIRAKNTFEKKPGTADMSLTITGIDEKEKQHTATKVVVAIKAPSTSFHAANILVFGDECTTKDLKALSMTIDPSNTIDPKLRRTAELLQDSCGSSPIKCTLRYIDGKWQVGYTRDGEDITASLLRSHLKPALDELHAALLEACVSACAYGSKILAVTDGFTFIVARLSNIQKVDGVGLLAEANFSSHSALDLTEDKSYIKLFNFFSYAALSDGSANIATESRVPWRQRVQQIESANKSRDLLIN